MSDLLTRFEHQTLPIMLRHGFLQAGFWTTIVGRSEQLAYLLAWESLAQRQEQWAAFASEAEWPAIRKSTEEKPRRNNEIGHAGPFLSLAADGLL